jgi:uncharacterized protein YcfJ
MKKAAAYIICLVTLGPTAALAHHNQYTKVVVKEHYSHPYEKTVVRKVVRVEHPRGHKHHGKRSYRDEVVYGQVINVEPIYRVSGQASRHDACVRYVRQDSAGKSFTPTLLGAIIGGAVGHRLGDNHGDAGAAAVAGGLLGASIGRDVGNHMDHNRRVVVDGPCGYGGSDHVRREVVEYAVRYRYNGEVYFTRMDYDPGEWIALDVKPV